MHIHIQHTYRDRDTKPYTTHTHTFQMLTNTQPNMHSNVTDDKEINNVIYTVHLSD